MSLLERFSPVLFLVFILPACSYGQVREPAVAGAFYPASPSELKKDVDRFINDAAVPASGGRIAGLICPHAGYQYSGPVAGYAYKAVKGMHFDTVVIIGPNHRARGFTDVSFWNKGAFKTPLGSVPVDSEFADAVMKGNPGKFVYYPDAHIREHSIEVELPFLQETLRGEFRIVPIVMGDYSKETCRRLAEAILKNIRGRSVLIIASSDLSHDKTYETASCMDKKGLSYAVSLDAQALGDAEARGETEMCGYGPVMALIYVMRGMGNVKGVLLKYANSGDTTGDRRGRIVGYGAAVFYKEDGTMEEDTYTGAEKKELLKLARDTITKFVSEGKRPVYETPAGRFAEKRGVFVTLHKHGELRGCIGYIEPVKPLYGAVVDNAVNSAVNDPRFPPVKRGELADIDIEISVLTPPEEIQGPEGFITGQHGIIIKKGFRSAVFLPQVAPEEGWTREETLRRLCVKAGMPPDEWERPGMKFYVFTADVFGEK